MALTNGDLYNLIQFISNKQSLSGYIPINSFNLELQAKNIILLREKLGLTDDYGMGQWISRQQKGQSTLLDDQTNKFKKESTLNFTSGEANLPSDYFRYDYVLVDGALDGVDILFGAELGRVINNAIDAPTTQFPYATFVENKLRIYPNTIGSATLGYYRVPTTPVFDYYVNNIGEIVYLGAGVVYTLQTGETGSAGQTAGTNVTSLSVELEWNDNPTRCFIFCFLWFN